MTAANMMSDKTMEHIVLNFQNRSFTIEDLKSSIDDKVVVENILGEIVDKAVAVTEKKEKVVKEKVVKEKVVKEKVEKKVKNKVEKKVEKKVKKNSPSYEDRQLEGVDPDKCQCRIWKNGMDNIQCSGKKKEGDFCGRHYEAATSGEWWMGLITETRPEEPMGPPNAKNGPSRHYWTGQEKPEKKKKNTKSSPKKKKEPVKEPVKKVKVKEPVKELVSEMKFKDVPVIFEDVGEDSGEELDLEELEKKEIFDITPCDLEEDIDLDAKEPLPVIDPVSLPLKKPTAKRCTTVHPLPPCLCCPPIDFDQPAGPVDWGSSEDECEPDDFDYEGVIYKKFPLDGLVINRISGMQMGYFKKDGTVKFFGDEEITAHKKNKE
jgi:hypothetical protein